MTIIIAADLSDGRKVMLADGKASNSQGTVTALRCTKIHKLTTVTRSRSALIGVAGTAVGQNLMCSVVEKYMASPEPLYEDLFFRLKKACGRLNFDWQCNAVMWLPTKDGSHELIAIDNKCGPTRIEEQTWWSEGSGRIEANSALLGLQMRCFEGLNEPWKPTLNDVDIALKVACQTELSCGGEPTFLSL